MIDVAALIGQPARHIAVRVPVVVINLHKAHAALDEPASEQDRVRERPRLLGGVAIEFVSRFRFLRQVSEFRHTGLHAKGQFVLLNPRQRFRIADLLLIHLVERFEPIERFAANLGRDARRIVDKEDRIARRPERDARMLAGQVTRLPQPGGDRLDLLGIRRLGDEHDESRQVVVERAEPVVHPGTDGRKCPFEHVPAGVELELRPMIVVRRPHRADDGNVVDTAGDVREPIANLDARLPVFAPADLHRIYERALLPVGVVDHDDAIVAIQ